MKTSVALLAATAAVANANSQANIKPLILGGTVVPAGTKTYNAGLRATDTGETGCGGSLITPTHVLTAAHCYGETNYVVIGSHYKKGNRDGEVIAVKKETLHPRFDLGALSYDYSIIELERPSTFPPVKPYSVDPEELV